VQILDGLGGQSPDTEPMFWIIGGTVFGGFALLWFLFFCSINCEGKDEQEDEAEVEANLVDMSSKFVTQQETFTNNAARKLKCGSCASPLDQRPVPKFCPFCNAPSTGYLMYEPRVGSWIKAQDKGKKAGKRK
jgi:hypothetical protein